MIVSLFIIGLATAGVDLQRTAMAIAGLALCYGGFRWMNRASAARAERLLLGTPHAVTITDFEFDASGYTARSDLGESRSLWANVAAIEETGPSFLFAITPYVNLIVPKRFFENDGQIEQFRSLLDDAKVKRLAPIETART